MRKKRVILITVVAAIIFVGGVLALNFFAFGKVKDISSIGVQDLSVTSEKVFFSPVFMTSSDIMSEYSYRIEGDTMYIKIKSVLVGGLSKPNVDIEGDFFAIEKIVLEDKEKQKVIWEKNPIAD